MDEIERTGFEARIALPADVREPVLDVRLRLGAIHWTEMIGGDDALPQLLHVRSLHHRSQLRLADEEALHQRMISKLEVGKHAQLLDRSRRQVPRLVDNQQRALVRNGELAEKRLQRREQRRLVDRLDRQAERDRHCPQHVVRVELRAHELRRDQLAAIEVLEEASHERGLARADLSGDDDEAFALMNAILQVRECPLVAPAAEEELRIGIELERLA